MATVADLIRRSLKLLGVLAAGESARAEDLVDGLVELNLLLGTWANQRLLVHGTRRLEYSINQGASPQTIGVGGYLDQIRPVRIDAAGYMLSGQTVETPITILTDSEYRTIADKTTQTSGPPRWLWPEWTAPILNLWLWPVPSAAQEDAQLVLYVWSRIAAFATSDTVSLPDGYENALAHALAVQMAPLYGVEPSGTLVQNANEAVAAIKRVNSPPSRLKCDPAMLEGGIFNLYDGDS